MPTVSQIVSIEASAKRRIVASPTDREGKGDAPLRRVLKVSKRRTIQRSQQRIESRSLTDRSGWACAPEIGLRA